MHLHAFAFIRFHPLYFSFKKSGGFFGFFRLNNALEHFGSTILGVVKALSSVILGVVDIENTVYYPHFVGTSEQFCPQAFPHFGGDILYIAIGYSFNLRLDRPSTQQKKHIYSAALCLLRCER